jgi:HK97 family phage major capsid protein
MTASCFSENLLAKIQAKKMYAADTNLEDLSFHMQELRASIDDIKAKAGSENRDLTVEEVKQIAALVDDLEEAQEKYNLFARADKAVQVLDVPVGRRTDPAIPGAENGLEDPVQPQAQGAATGAKFGRVEVGQRMDRGCFGFENLGVMAKSIAIARNGGAFDQRLRRAQSPGTVGNETTPADGGYAVPPDFRDEIMRKVEVEAPLYGLTDKLTSTSNSITFPKDETTPWQASGGMRGAWTAEAGQITASKPALLDTTIKLEKLAALVNVTEELLEDAPALGRYLYSRVPSYLGWQIDNAIINGTGTGQPLGVLASAALISAPEVSPQAAGTITYDNLIDMWARVYGRGQSRGVWIVAPSAISQFMRMTSPAATGQLAVPVYLPPNGLADKPFATLLGRPVIPTEVAAALGTPGDIIFADLSQYITVTKTGGMIKIDTSMHLYFDYDALAFRFVIRIGGQPWWGAPITGKDGVTQYSAFVALATRDGVYS